MWVRTDSESTPFSYSDALLAPKLSGLAVPSHLMLNWFRLWPGNSAAVLNIRPCHWKEPCRDHLMTNSICIILAMTSIREAFAAGAFLMFWSLRLVGVWWQLGYLGDRSFWLRWESREKDEAKDQGEMRPCIVGTWRLEQNISQMRKFDRLFESAYEAWHKNMLFKNCASFLNQRRFYFFFL